MAIAGQNINITITGTNLAGGAITQAQAQVRGLGAVAGVTGRSLYGVSIALRTIARGAIVTGTAATGAGIYMAKMASDFGNQMRYANTQIGFTEKNLQTLSVAVLDMSRKTVGGTKTLTDALYDIYSTVVNLGKTQQDQLRNSLTLLDDFRKAAIAGNTDVRTVAQGAITMMNAAGLSVDDMSRLLDIQFKLVQRGKGEYKDFANVMYQIVPAGVAFGQSLETIAGATAFTTINLGRTRQGAVSTARAMEQLMKPSVTEGLKKIGVNAVDASGKYKQLNVIITDMATKGGLAMMTEPRRQKVLSEIFGVGSIQARRFFDVAIPRFQDLNKLVNEAQHSGGALAQAYEQMAKSPAVAFQFLISNIKALAISLGQLVLPRLLLLVDWVNRLIDRFNHWSPGVRKIIADFVTFGGVITLVTGLFLMFNSRILMVLGVLYRFGGNLVELLGAFGVMLVVMPLIGAAIMYFRDHAKEAGNAVMYLKTEGIKMWNTLKPAILDLVRALEPLIPALVGLVVYIITQGIPVFAHLVEAMIPLTKILVDIAVKVIPLVAGAFKVVLEIIDKLAPILPALVAGFLAFKAVTIVATILNAVAGGLLTVATVAPIAQGGILGVAGAAETAAAGITAMLGPIALLLGDLYLLKTAHDKVAGANKIATDSFSKDTIPTLLKTGNTLKIVSGQFKFGPFGSYQAKQVQGIFKDWEKGTIDTKTAFEKLAKVVGVSHDQMVKVAQATATAALKANDFKGFGDIIRNAMALGIIGVNNLAASIEQARLKGTGLAAALAQIPENIRSLVTLQIAVDTRGLTNETRAVAQDKSMRSGAYRPPAPPAPTKPAKTVAQQIQDGLAQFNKDMAGLTGTSGGGSKASGPSPQKTALSGLHSGLLAIQKWVDQLSSALATANRRGRTTPQVVADYTKQMASAADKVRALVSAVSAAVSQHLVPKALLSRTQTLATTAATLSARWSSLNDRMKTFSQGITGLFGQIGQLSGISGVQTQEEVSYYFSQSLSLAQQLGNTLTQLQKRGLSTNLMTQLTQMSPADALRVGNLLLQSNIPLINQTITKISQLGVKTATTLTDQIFGPEVRALKTQTQNFVSALKALIRELNTHLPPAQRIPVHQQGGIATRSQVGIVGDVPQGEAIIPLNQRGVQFVTMAFKAAIEAGAPAQGGAQITNKTIQQMQQMVQNIVSTTEGSQTIQNIAGATKTTQQMVQNLTSTKNDVTTIGGPNTVHNISNMTVQNIHNLTVQRLLPQAPQVVPAHQFGGIATSPRIGMWGDVPQGEALIPLNSRGADFLAAAMTRATPHTPVVPSRLTPARERGDVNLHIQGQLKNEKEIVHEVEWSRLTEGW